MGFWNAVLAAVPAVASAQDAAAGQRGFDQRSGRSGAGPDLRGMVGHTAGSTPYRGPKDGRRMNDSLAHLHRAAGTAR